MDVKLTLTRRETSSANVIQRKNQEVSPKKVMLPGGWMNELAVKFGCSPEHGDYQRALCDNNASAEQ